MRVVRRIQSLARNNTHRSSPDYPRVLRLRYTRYAKDHFSLPSRPGPRLRSAIVHFIINSLARFRRYRRVFLVFLEH